MPARPLGILDPEDPLHHFLRRHVLPHPPCRRGPSDLFDVHRLDARGAVFRYTDRATGAAVVGKFYGVKIPGDAPGVAAMRNTFLHREAENMRRLRALGFDRPPVQVVRPLAVEPAINGVLIQEYATGVDLQASIAAATAVTFDPALSGRLTAVGRFLAMLHERSRTGGSAGAAAPLQYLDKLIAQLTEAGLLDGEGRAELGRLRAAWAEAGALDGGPEVLAHGDATPPHFLFDAGDLTVIDLERVWPGDAAADLGCLTAELRYLFRCAGSRDGGRYIDDLQAAYLAESRQPVGPLLRRSRFYEGCYTLRISRNGWIAPQLRRRLIADARCRLAI